MTVPLLVITRPLAQAEELAARLGNRDTGTDSPVARYQTLLLPAQRFEPLALTPEQLQSVPGSSALLIFTSPRAVEFGLPQVPDGVLKQVRLAAIGPTSAAALAAAGLGAVESPAQGYTSEALLSHLRAQRAQQAAQALQKPGPGEHGPGEPGPENPDPEHPGVAILVTAPGGRGLLQQALQADGWQVDEWWVYRREPATITPEQVSAISDASSCITVWTSVEAMHFLRRRLPQPAWERLCAGPWVLVSKRQSQAARQLGASQIQLAEGPDNAALERAVRECLRALEDS